MDLDSEYVALTQPSWLAGRYKSIIYVNRGVGIDTESDSVPSSNQCCGLWTLSCDFVPHNYETLKWLSSLPILMQESFWW